MIYLDNAATTFPKPEIVYQAVDKIQKTLAVNAGRGSYHTAQKANDILNAVRKQIAELTFCSCPEKVILTPSATIAMNQIINGLSWSKYSNVYITPFEHNAVVRTLKSVSDKYGFEIIQLPFDGITHKLDEVKMLNMFAVKHPDAVFTTHISNVTGTIIPVNTIFHSAKKYHAVTILDASQSLGMLDCDVRNIPVDFLVFAGHKNLYGHIGTGGFICCSEIELKLFITGGTGSDSLNTDMPAEYPSRYEAGSHDIISVASLNAALEWLKSTNREAIFRHKKELTAYLIDKLNSIKSLKLYLPTDLNEHIAIVSFTHKEYLPSELAEILDMDFDIAVRSGYHCVPYVHQLIGTEKNGGTVRVSLGYFNTKEEINLLADALKEL